MALITYGGNVTLYNTSNFIFWSATTKYCKRLLDPNAEAPPRNEKIVDIDITPYPLLLAASYADSVTAYIPLFYMNISDIFVFASWLNS